MVDLGARVTITLVASIVIGACGTSAELTPDAGVVVDAAIDAGLDGAATGTCTPGLPVLVGAARNARDLGGIPVASGRTACGELYRGAYLTSLTEAGCVDLAALGVKTVIDLRMETEGGGRPVPCTNGPRVISAPLPIPYELSPENYLADLDAAPSVKLVFDALGDDATYPAYVNCVYGRDRTGVIAGLILGVLGASRAEIMADYERTHDTGLYIRPDSMEAVLDVLDTRGGAEAYLRSIGVAPESLAKLRARALR